MSSTFLKNLILTKKIHHDNLPGGFYTADNRL